MSHFHHLPLVRAVLSWMLASFAGVAIAQAPTESASPRPPIPTRLQYSSAIGAYQAYADEPVQSWREANDRVGRIGGWRAYAKEITPGKPESAKNANPSSDPHAGHHRDGTP